MKTEEPTHKIAIVISFIPATNTRGHRIGMTLPRFKKRKAISYDHSCRDTEEGARKWLLSQGVTPDTLLDLGDKYAFAVEWDQRPALFRAFGIPERNS